MCCVTIFFFGLLALSLSSTIKRKQIVSRVLPSSCKQLITYQNNDLLYGAGFACDDNHSTFSIAKSYSACCDSYGNKHLFAPSFSLVFDEVICPWNITMIGSQTNSWNYKTEVFLDLRSTRKMFAYLMPSLVSIELEIQIFDEDTSFLNF